MTQKLHTLAFNSSGGKLRRTVRGGRSYLVAPGVLITHGVHEGSGGGIYYPADELSKCSGDWNSIPIVNGHPKDESGQPISVNTAGVLDKYGMGMLDNAVWDSEAEKQRAEHCFDNEKTTSVSPSVLQALQAGMPFEISTGMMMDLEETSGEYNGKKYIGIARNIKPDHLAVLADAQGACSVKDGCGCMVTNEASFRRVMNAISDIVQAKYGYSWYVRDVYSDFFVYSDGNGDLFRQAYSVSADGTVSVSKSTPEKVRWVTEYQTQDGAFVGNCSCSGLKSKEIDVDKKAMIAALIGNGQGAWTEADRATLESYPDDKLKKLMPAPAPAVTPPILNPQPVVNALPKPVSFDAWVAQAPAEIQGQLRQMVANEQQIKASLIANIQASPKNQFAAEFLATLPVDQLRGMAALASTDNAVNYGPAGGVPILAAAPVVNAQASWGPPAVPQDVILAN